MAILIHSYLQCGVLGLFHTWRVKKYVVILNPAEILFSASVCHEILCFLPLQLMFLIASKALYALLYISYQSW